MKAGTLDRRIRIESLSAVIDPIYGPQPGAWLEFATVWANVQDVLPSRGEDQQGGIRVSNRPARIRIRYLVGVTSAMRIVLLDQGNRLLKIIAGPAEMGRKEAMELMAEEYSTEGNTP